MILIYLNFFSINIVKMSTSAVSAVSDKPTLREADMPPSVAITQNFTPTLPQKWEVTSPYVKVIQESDTLPIPPVTPALSNGYEPDRFQAFAIEAIEKGENVLITAKTGSGKTFVGEYQIAKSLQRGGRVFYTTPIKSLSNQKFHDLKLLFPQASVGIMTGDIKFRPDAQIIVMTTEILRNLLFKQGTQTEGVGSTAVLSLDGLDAVIFDEVHYINDIDRGHVWEETLILLNPSIKLVLLSATLSQPYDFAKWLGELKQVPIWLISTLWRAVPLYHNIVDSRGKLKVIYDPKEKFQDEVYKTWLQERKGMLLEQDKFKQKVKDARRDGFEGPVKGKIRIESFEHQLNNLLDDLSLESCLPAIVFQFSRKGCERLAKQVKSDFIDGKQAADVKHIWNFHLSRYKDSLEKSPQYHELFALVVRGIAFHHSGLQPFLKEILEILFSKGLVKVLFATETFAVGINMPTKTVIFTALEKYSDGGPRLLHTSEYVQMAGRAGRRGKDDKGIVIYLPQKDPLELYEIRPVLTGQAQTFCSRINFHYDFLLKVANKGQDMTKCIQESYWWCLENHHHQQVLEEIENLQKKMNDVPLTKEQIEVFSLKDEIQERIDQYQNAKKKQAQRDLHGWYDEHEGVPWISAGIHYNNWKDMKKRLGVLMNNKNEWMDPEHIPVVEARRLVLSEFGYVDSGSDSSDLSAALRLASDSSSSLDSLRLASEVNEGHPFLLTELFLRQKENKTLDLFDLLTVLAVFINDGKEDEDKYTPLEQLNITDSVYNALKEMKETCVKGLALEKKYNCLDPGFWKISTLWVEPIYQWLSAAELSSSSETKYTIGSLAQQFGFFEGNVIKSLMKLASLVEEYQSLATLAGDTEALKLLEPARELILRDVVVAESIYLRLD